MSQAPSVGRIVHYQPQGDPAQPPRAAIVIEATGDGMSLKLAAFRPDGLYFTYDTPHAETPTPGHWNWPPRT